MTLNFYTLSVIYLVYSFLGWVAETVVATIRGGRFANRGAAAGPFCFIYGTTGVLLAVSFGDLRTEPVYLFFACMMAATVMEWITAKLLERLHRRKWWDYSGKKFNLNGYLKLMKNCLDCEQNESCREMILESMQYVPQLVEREAITHRFFLTFSYEPGMKAANNSPGAIAARLNEQAEVARRYLDRCGISVLEPEYVDNFVLELFYELVNKHTSQHIRLPEVRMICWGPSTVFTMKALSAQPGAEAGKSRRQKEKVVYAKEKKRGAAWAGGRRDNNP